MYVCVEGEMGGVGREKRVVCLSVCRGRLVVAGRDKLNEEGDIRLYGKSQGGTFLVYGHRYVCVSMLVCVIEMGVGRIWVFCVCMGVERLECGCGVKDGHACLCRE